MKRLDDMVSRHRRIWELMPWVLNGTASADDRREVETHIASCAECHDEFARQQRLQAEVREGWPVPMMRDASVVFAALSARLQPLAPVLSDNHPPMFWWLRALAALVVVQVMALSVMGTALWLRGHAEPAASYRTLSLSAPAAPPATVRVVFTDGLKLGDMQSLLQRLHLQIVAGPSPAGVYSLGPAAPDAVSAAVASASTVAALRAQPGVRFAEPVSDPQGH